MEQPGRRFYEFDSFRVDIAGRQLWEGEKLVRLTPKVFDMLLVLLENKGRTVTKEELISKVWTGVFVEENSLSRNISTLRKALGDHSNEQKFIKTLPKSGYRFTAQVEETVEPLTTEKTIQNHLLTEAVTLRSGHRPRQISPRIILSLAVISVFAPALIWIFTQWPANKVKLAGLTEHERRQLSQHGSGNPEAYQDYVNGRTLWHRRSAGGLEQSILLLERAVKNDPNFALAHAALGDAYAFEAEKSKLARAQAEEAARLNPFLGEPYATIGFVQMFWDWKLREAGQSLRKSVEMSPDYATAHEWYAINLFVRGYGGAALAEMKRALELAPNSPAINADLCQTFYFLRKYEEAIAQCRQTLELNENFMQVHFYLYEIYTAKGSYDEAVAEFFKLEKFKNDLSPVHLEKLRLAYAGGGIRRFWQTLVEFPEHKLGNYQMAQYYARLGDKEKALSELRKAYENRDPEFVFFFANPVFYDIGKEPQFTEIIRLFGEV